MIIAGGIDIGGTKIEAQVFGPDWQPITRYRWPTPRSYDQIVTTMADAVHWCEAQGGTGLPVGISAAGLINPASGFALTSNLPATGRPFPADIATAAGRPVAWINDCRALALSEATLRAATGANPAVALILGTGVAGGVVTKGVLLPSPAQVGGEFGHFPLAAAPVITHGLPLIDCGCGCTGCAETYLSAPGLARIVTHLTAQTHSPEAIVAGRATTPAFARAWEIWLDLATEFLVTLCFTLDPQVIVLGGSLSRAPGLTDNLTAPTVQGHVGGLSDPRDPSGRRR